MGQSTTVSGQVTDAGGQSWNNGTYSFQFVPPQSNFTTPPTWSGGAFNPNTPLTGALNGSGAYSRSVPSNTAITPSLSQWRLQVCSGTVPNKCTTVIQTITGATQTVNVTPPAISMEVTPNTSAYLDAEILGPVEGTTYFNVISGTQRTYHNGVWQTSSGGSGTVNSGTQCFPAVYSASSAQVGPSSMICDASTFAGADFGIKLNSCSTFLTSGTGGTCVLPDSVAGDASGTTINIASNVSFTTPGSAAFTVCTVNMGKFSKYRNTGSAIFGLSGTNCHGFTHLGATASMQDSDHFVIDGLRLDCNNASGSIGITDTPSANGAQDEIVNIEVVRCAVKGVYLAGIQFGHFENWNLSSNYLNWALYATVEPGGASSNTFTAIKASSPGSGVNGVIWNNAVTSPLTDNVFVNPNFQNGTVANLAVIGRSDVTPAATHVHIIGGSPEHDGNSAASVTIDGNIILSSGALFTNNAQVVWDNPDIQDAVANPVMRITNGSMLALSNPRGSGKTFSHFVLPDATSMVTFSGMAFGLGDAQNAATYPDALPTSGYQAAIAGKPTSRLTNDIPNAFTGNSLVPPFSSTTGTASNAITVDPIYGPVNCVTFIGSTGTDSTNRAVFTDWVTSHPGSAWDLAASWLVMSTTTESFKMTGIQNIPGWNGNSSSPEDNLNLAAGQWTGIRSYKSGNSAGSGAQLEIYPIGTSAPTVCFTRVQTAAVISGSPGEAGLMSSVLAGLVNPNVPIASSVAYAADGGAADAAVVNAQQVPTTLTVGLEIDFLPTANNSTTTPTLNLNGTGAKTITKIGTSALAVGDLTTTAIAKVVYDGTRWQLQNPQTNSAVTKWSDLNAPTTSQTLEMGANPTTWNWGATATSAQWAWDTAGTLKYKRRTAASAVAVTNSPDLIKCGIYQASGTPTFADDCWSLRVVENTGTNAVSQYQIVHSSGSSGQSQLLLPGNGNAGTTPGISFSGAPGVGLNSFSTTTLQFVTPASGLFDWDINNASVWKLDTANGFYPTNDASLDVGKTGNRVRDLFLSRNIVLSGVTPSAATGKLAAPIQVGYVSCTQANCASSATTLFTALAADALYKADVSIACTTSTATATGVVTITYTDVSNTTQTIVSAAATCTTLGAASVAAFSTPFSAKASTVIQYSVTQANSPAGLQGRVAIYQESTN